MIVLKILRKIIWFIIFVVVAVVAIIFVYKGILKFEFADSVKYQNIKYATVEDNVCLTFNSDGYQLDNCKGGDSEFTFNSNKGCTMHYGKGYNSFIFDCGYKNINLVKLQEFTFNKIRFNNKKKDYVLINKSLFSTLDGQQTITFNFVDEKTIKFSKYINDTLADEEVCAYKYERDESMGLECSRFYGYSSFKIEKYDGNNLIIINRGNKITFTRANEIIVQNES